MLQKKAREETTVPSLVAKPKEWWRDSPEVFPKFSEDMFILLSD